MLRTRAIEMLLLSVLVFLVTGADAQSGYHESTSGEYRTPNGNVVKWSRTSSHYHWDSHVGWIIEKPEKIEINGSDQELVTSDLDPVGHPNARVENYDSLLRARDRMRGLVRPVISGGLYHVCDNPDCEYLDRDRVESTPFVNAYTGYGISWYMQYLNDHPEDWEVMREFALAVGILLDYDLAIDVMYTVYLNRPELGAEPFDPEFLGIEPASLRTFLVKCVKHAHREPSAQKWFMVAMVMQTEGRYERASEMLDRAIELGLDESIAEHFLVDSP
jgi:tetratricopeptide (TPR) repeat protein